MLLDTFADRRNGFVFVTNAVGAKSDTQIANEGRDVNTSWDAVWTVATRRDAGGWSAEIRIPFKTLRFERGDDRIWGVNFSRRIRRKNEIDYWSVVPRVYNLYRAGLAGTLTGLADASQGRNLRIKPWVAADAIRPVAAPSFDAGAHAGLDVKYGVTPSLTLDVTVKPDFAQAEADEQQVNLTQFSLYYPEKREFFLENSGMFYFGDIPRESRLGNNRFSAPEEEMLLFFSRRIGLTGAGQPIPIDAGARLTGRAGVYGIGADDDSDRSGRRARPATTTPCCAAAATCWAPPTSARSSSRASRPARGDYNRVYGADANFRFYRALSLNGVSREVGDARRHRRPAVGQGLDRLERQFPAHPVLAAVGRRQLPRRHRVRQADRHPQALRRFRRPAEAGGAAQVRDPRAAPAHALQRLHRSVERQADAHRPRRDERVLRERRQRRIRREPALRTDRGAVPDPSGSGVRVGQYGWTEYNLLVETNHSRMISASLDLTTGGFWSGTQRSTKLGVIVRPSYHLQIDLALQRNDIDLPFPMHAFVTNLVTSRIGYAFSTRTFLDTLLQYNTDLKQLSANVRFDLIHRPLSDLFVVYNEQRLTDQPTPINPGRGLILKYTHMLAF